MLGSTQTITLDGSGGTAKVLQLINQDNYSSEYFLDEATVQWRTTIRHTTDTVKAGTQDYNRHTVTFERYLKPTSTFPMGQRSQIIFTIRASKDDVTSDVVDVSEAMSFYMVKAGGIAARLIGYES